MNNIIHSFHSLRGPRFPPPTLTLAQRVVDKIIKNALIYRTETGEALVGFAVPQEGKGEPDLYVIDTIAPDESAVRESARFLNGDTLQDDVMLWWSHNWKRLRKLSQDGVGNPLEAKFDLPLKHLGDWHKHPGDMVEPSGGDAMTARRQVAEDENQTPQIVVLLATIWDRYSAAAAQAADKIADDPEQSFPHWIQAEGDTMVRLDGWYMSRAYRHFTRLPVVIVPDSSLPALIALPWNLKDVERFHREVFSLRDEGFTVQVDYVDADDKMPLEICVGLYRPGEPYFYMVVTGADYPAQRPMLRTVPASRIAEIPDGADAFLALWPYATPISSAAYPDWAWTDTRTILELVEAVAARLPEKADS